VSFAESTVEEAALQWFGELGFAAKHGPHIAPGESHQERTVFGEAFLPQRLRVEAIGANDEGPWSDVT
jgi:type I restriction enzyme R subunit